DTEIKASEVDQIARKHIISKGYKTIPHSVGHGIGIDVHENPHLSPKSKDILKEGMVFSIEPGIYIPGFGGVRIEDLVVLEKNGLRLLTHSPKHLTEM
ncbi:MAG: M24 family metallopeptidase, partial [Candidatus Levybacteria bacterium]|nr:M24 family metallopeptidase [Candidatus Levybacteria bacterium]